MSIDLPLIWAGIIAVAVLLYVLLDGFDLGIGILFPFARSPSDRDAMMNAIAPVWDGNETWLVLGGGGLLAAFPIAYSIVMPAMYLPIILMLLALILRGVAFEFRLRGRARGKRIWTIAFAGGSLTAAFAQGLVLGGFIQGVTVTDGAFSGGAFDWLTPYTLLVACGLTAGYTLLGAGWLMFKTEDEVHGDARRWAAIAGAFTALFLVAASIATLFVHPRVAERWGVSLAGVDWSRFAPLAAIPLLGLAGLAIVAMGLRSRSHGWPFIGGLLVFLSGYIGLAVGFTPYVVPYAVTYAQAAAADNALALMLVGVGALLPVILGYTVWVYWVFRGKVAADAGYH
ncbi:MAG: cytochrome d ubiquinol oxidase subunit II [Caulobacterales bacterium 32-69-10]|nr:MAG: cytochrome d ubiquinol oxidase subunit II [Caulobacterales bacterium 32-69-10]